MSDTVTAALIAFGGVVIGYIFNMITDYIKNKHENQRIELSLKADEINSRKSISVQYITNKRVDWIYEVRNTLSDYIALAQECANKKVNNKIGQNDLPLGAIDPTGQKTEFMRNMTGERVKTPRRGQGNVFQNQARHQCLSFQFLQNLNLLLLLCFG